MNQIATNQTYSMLVTDTDIEKAMYTLSGLPGRGPTDQKLTRAVYMMALRGVTRHSLEMAVQNFITGHSHCDHSFMPAPPELRRECERVMKPILDSLTYTREVEKAKAATAEHRRNSSKRDNTAGRDVLAVGIDHLTWVSRAKHDYPTGSLWVAKTATVYGPVKQAGMSA